MPLIEVHPQRVEHSDGWAVASFDREHMKYEEGSRVALVAVGDGFPVTRVHTDSLTWVAEDGSETPLTAAEGAIVWPRLIEGMRALDITSELFDG